MQSGLARPKECGLGLLLTRSETELKLRDVMTDVSIAPFNLRPIRVLIVVTAILTMLMLGACSPSNQTVERANGNVAEGTVADFVVDGGLERLSIKTKAGEVMTFEIGDAIPAVLWGRRHLDAHERSGQRIIVTFMNVNGVLVATKLEEGGF